MADWPNRFIYVCNASRGAVVNALPLFHAGLDRIAQVVVLCGAEQNSTDPHQRAEALDPAERLGEYLSAATNKRISRKRDSFRTLYGDAGNIGVWQNKTRGLAETAPGPIVYNIKAGTKEMAIGGVLGLSGGKGDTRLITVRDNLLIELVTPTGQEKLPVPGHEIPLPELLSFYGFREYTYNNRTPPHQQRKALEAWYLHYQGHIRAFAAAFEPRAASLWRELQRLTAPLAPPSEREFALPCRIELAQDPAIAQMLTTLEGIPGLQFEWRGGIVSASTVTDAFVARFLRGGWIEAAAFLALQDLAQDVGDAEVFANVHLSPELGNVQATEMDVALLCRSKLVIVETKSSSMTGRASRDANERSLAQLEANKRQLLGQVGHALVLNPCITQDAFSSDTGSVAAQVRRAGLTEFVGPGAIARLTARVRELLPPERSRSIEPKGAGI